MDKKSNLINTENFANNKKIELREFNFIDSSKVFFFDVFFKLIISFFVLYFITELALSEGVSYLEYVQQRGWLGFLLTLLSPLFLCALFFIYSKSNRINYISELKPKTKLNPYVVLICFVVVAISLFMMSGVFNCFDYLFVSLGYKVSGEMVFEINSVHRLFLAIFSMAVMPAIFEELIYRGIVLKGLLQKFKPQVAILISTLLFTLMHGSLDQTLFQFFLGYLLGFVAYKTQNITYSIIIHFLNNLTVLLLTFFKTDILVGNVQDPLYIVLSVGLFIAGAALLIGIYFIFKKYIKLKDKENNEVISEELSEDKAGFLGLFTKTTRMEKIAFWGGIAVGFLIWLVNTVSNFS